MAQFSVDGKVAIVTGAGSGINYEFAKLLAEKGCSVVIGDISLRPEAQALLEQYTTKPNVIFQKTDVTNWTDLSRLFEKTVGVFGTYDIICPGAGVFEPDWSSFWQPPGAPSSGSKDPTEGAGRYAMIDINLIHPIRATQLAMAEFLSPSDGSSKVSPSNPKRILHISSIACEQKNLPYPIYTATKYGITGFVRSMGDLDQTLGIRVNAVAPGVVKTPLWLDNADKLALVDEEKDVWVTPAEVAQAMLQLLQDPELGGGTVLEVGHDHTRVIPMLGNMGPKGDGLGVSKASIGSDDVYRRLGEDNWGKQKVSGR